MGDNRGLVVNRIFFDIDYPEYKFIGPFRAGIQWIMNRSPINALIFVSIEDIQGYLTENLFNVVFSFHNTFHNPISSADHICNKIFASVNNFDEKLKLGVDHPTSKW